jgi:prepilin-type N-terminal cleavage/methylation domain-containing protein
MKLKSAFTLIELLVVIAIIAILAAILFPVFAQAKAAAKAASSTSNVKQNALALIMYTNDYDDAFPIDTAWYLPPASQSGAQACYGTSCFATWSWMVQPYMKNAAILQDPLAPNTATGQTWHDAYYVQYGLNTTWIAPWFPTTTPFTLQTTTTTTFNRPAETLLLAAKYANSENQSGYDWGFFPPSNGPLLAAHIQPPDCNDIAAWCDGSWGTDSWIATTLKLTTTAGGDTGGISIRSGNNMITAWVDGHARKITPGALAVGTTWTPTATVSQITLLPNWKQVNLWGDQ